MDRFEDGPPIEGGVTMPGDGIDADGNHVHEHTERGPVFGCCCESCTGTPEPEVEFEYSAAMEAAAAMETENEECA